jgi:hypothetical protein
VIFFLKAYKILMPELFAWNILSWQDGQDFPEVKQVKMEERL